MEDGGNYTSQYHISCLKNTHGNHFPHWDDGISHFNAVHGKQVPDFTKSLDLSIFHGNQQVLQSKS